MGNTVEYIKRMDPNFVNRAKRRWLEEAGSSIQGQAKELAPVRRGNLRKSISYRIQNDESIIFTPVQYAPYVEYGTYKMAAQPYLRPAVSKMKPRLMKRLSSLLNEEV